MQCSKRENPDTVVTFDDKNRIVHGAPARPKLGSESSLEKVHPRCSGSVTLSVEPVQLHRERLDGYQFFAVIARRGSEVLATGLNCTLELNVSTEQVVRGFAQQNSFYLSRSDLVLHATVFVGNATIRKL